MQQRSLTPRGPKSKARMGEIYAVEDLTFFFIRRPYTKQSDLMHNEE